MQTPDGEPTQAPSGSRLLIYGGIFTLNIIVQCLLYISLPMSLGSLPDNVNPSMAVVLIYETFMFFVFFSIADVLLDPFVQINEQLPELMIASTGLQNAVNAICVIFSAAANRTPLTLQMSSSLLVNLLAPFYKLWVFGIPFRAFREYRWYLAACALYLGAFVLTLVDKIRNAASGQLSPYAILWVIGMILIVTFNTQQEKVQAKVDFAKLSGLQTLKLGVVICRKQMMWLFLFSWIGALLAFIPGFDQAGQLNSEIFISSWAAFLPFTDVWMDVFLASYILTLLTGIYMNKYDSSFNMLTSNISAVLVLWTGWVPALMENTVGFVPSVPLTSLAMIASVLAVYPSYKYSLHMRAIMVEHEHKEEEAVGLIQKP